MASCAVFIAKPEAVSFAEAMSRLRMWFDNRKIQPASFKLTSDERGSGFSIGFLDQHDAAAFGDSFGWSAPPA